MLYWSAIFVMAAVVSALFAFGGVAGETADIAEILFYFFLVVLGTSFVLRAAQRNERDERDDDDLGRG
ncbi:DUF1328 domain-containing protein [Citreimonas sp.]|uniref:DUF1328 domain-containing protein n=1 Tax=Citreimonas sp. TaxID=3036715 RepID=UPI0035C7A6B8